MFKFVSDIPRIALDPKVKEYREEVISAAMCSRDYRCSDARRVVTSFVDALIACVYKCTQEETVQRINTMYDCSPKSPEKQP